MKSICHIRNSREKASSEDTVWNRNAAHPEGPTLPRLPTRVSQYMPSSERLFKPGWGGLSVTCKRKSPVGHWLILGVQFKHTGSGPLSGCWARIISKYTPWALLISCFLCERHIYLQFFYSLSFSIDHLHLNITFFFKEHLIFWNHFLY